MPEPLVSVNMITYNHAPYIAQAIEGVLMQKTNFPFELIIGEDCSTDGTREIVFDYSLRYPKIIKVVSSKNNVGMHENSARTTESCQGKYIAYCEGDDYWTHSEKLQKQIDFLEANHDYAGCFHNVEFIYENNFIYTQKYQCAPNQKKTVTAFDILKSNIIPTCSIVLRKKLIIEIPTWASDLKMGDWPNNFLIALINDWAYLPVSMGAYRRHSNGVWSKMSYVEQKKENIKFYEAIYKNFNNPYKRLSVIYTSNLHSQIAEHYYKDNQHELFKLHLEKAKNIFYDNKIFSFFLFKIYIKYSLPSYFHLIKICLEKFKHNYKRFKA